MDQKVGNFSDKEHGHLGDGDIFWDIVDREHIGDGLESNPWGMEKIWTAAGLEYSLPGLAGGTLESNDEIFFTYLSHFGYLFRLVSQQDYSVFRKPEWEMGSL